MTGSAGVARQARDKKRDRRSAIGFCPRCRRRIYLPFVEHDADECPRKLHEDARLIREAPNE